MVGLVSDQESGIGTGLTSDCHRTGRYLIRLMLGWRQIGIDWHRIEIGLAPDWNGLALDWHWIGA